MDDRWFLGPFNLCRRAFSLACLVSSVLSFCGMSGAAGQELVVRPGPAALDDLEADEDQDGIPDGWYNVRDATLVTGGPVGPTCLRFESDRPGRHARASKAFGIDGRTTEAVVIGLWIRLEGVGLGERLGELPSLLIDFLGPELREEGRGLMGPWDLQVSDGDWVRVAKRIPVPPDTRDAILSVGLLGGTGVFNIDGLSIAMMPRGGRSTTNLILNGDFELGDPEPAHWLVHNGTTRVFPGHNSESALELRRAGAMAQTAVAMPIGRFDSLAIELSARTADLRGAGGAVGEIYFVDDLGRVLPGAAAGARPFRFSGTSAWRGHRATVRVPRGASAAVLQFDKTDRQGSLAIDDVKVFASPDPSRGEWTPYHVTTDTTGWHPYQPGSGIEPGSALDAAPLLDGPAGHHGFVEVEHGLLQFEDGTPARFFGVVALPPLATIPPGRIEPLADDLARRGVNLVRFSDLDSPLGPGRSLLDDAAPDTSTLDPILVERFDALVEALKSRGVYIALELIASRRFRLGDELKDAVDYPLGGGPAAAFSPEIRTETIKLAKAMLGRINPKTGLALKDDPVLAWVVISGEHSLFDLIDDPDQLTKHSAEELKALADQKSQGSGRRLWQTLESEQWSKIADELRSWGVRVPIAGASHWRREPEFSASQLAEGLDLVEDRLYWMAPPYAQAARRSALWHADGSLSSEVSQKRRGDRPYLVGQWCANTDGDWALPYESGDLLLMAETAAGEGWDALVRRGVFLYPESWGASAAGIGGGADIFPIAEALNGNPAIFAFLPHAASIYLRTAREAEPRTRRPSRIATWDPASGRLVVSTPSTQALVGWGDHRPARFERLTIEHDSEYAAVAVSAIGRESIEDADRLLVTAMARVEPTGLTYADGLGREVADPGRPPLLIEPIHARVTWKRPEEVRAFCLDSSGKRVGPATVEATPDGKCLIIDGRSDAIHFELIVVPDSPK